ncbi:MAG: adenosylmethionine--8-amino-7-oxononanoate aminotransferase BioA, partial [Ruminococcus sp.]|nr:adenosylmethionine--8-amino-7-oxononanoate aminotransferase BioA [Ruminococcus sp.]
ISKIRNIEDVTRREMAGFKDDRIKEVRIMGGCVCIEVYDSKVLEGFRQFAYEHGVFSRTFLKYMYAMVPYVISDNELITVLDTMKAWFTK